MATRKFFNIVPSADVRKFWTVIYPYREDRRVACVMWGRMGTQGQSKVQEFKDPVLARAWVDARVREKQGHGYVEGEDNAREAAGITKVTLQPRPSYVMQPLAFAQPQPQPKPQPQPLPEFPLTTQRVITLDED